MTYKSQVCNLSQTELQETPRDQVGLGVLFYLKKKDFEALVAFI